MTTNVQIAAEIQKLHGDALVELFQLDTLDLGFGVYRFTSTGGAAVPIVWQGQTFPYVPVETSGWEWNGQGQLPTPTISLAVANTAFGGLVVAGRDLLGAKLTRWRTFAKFLDNGATPDPTAFLPVDEYVIEQKTNFNKQVVSWQLSAVLDKQGRKVPRRIALKNTCTHVYRRYNSTSGTFDYSVATCPYNGANYFAADGTVTTADKDHCGKRVTDCKLRFGADAELPTRAFPGIAQYRT